MFRIGVILAITTFFANPLWAQEAETPELMSATESAEETSVQEEYSPLLGFDWEDRTFEVFFSLAERAQTTSQIPVDRYGTIFAPDAGFNTQLRIGARYNSNMSLAPFRMVATYEHDLLSGMHSGGTDPANPEGVDFPGSEDTETELRNLFLQLDYTREAHLFLGYMTSHWGLGLIANDGDHGWELGSARFSDPRGGDRMLRGLVAVGPYTDLNLLFAAGFDQVQQDDVTLEGDEAYQGIASVTLGYQQPSYVGAYAVIRRQTSADEKDTEIQAIDVAGAYQLDLGEGTLTLSGELVFIWGTTELAPSVEYPIHDVIQMGIAGRASWDMGSYGAVLDFLYASGDDNFDDSRQSGFKADVNFDMGMLLYDHVIAAQYARAPITASDPDLIGVPNEDLERLPTRGSATNTIAFFPRGFWRPFDGFEIYGGPLLAFTAENNADPFNSRVAGGDPRNAVDGDPGSFMGTELDLGLRYQGLFAGTELTVGVEAAILLPGSAFATNDGGTMESVSGGRAMIRYRF